MINIYDFDGVLCDPLEDTVFRLPDNPLDDTFIKFGMERYGVGRLCNHRARLRHMILQEILYERGHVCARGPEFDNLNDDPFYVLTARSSSGAVARVSEFFEHKNKRPEELFFVGPVSKCAYLTYFSESFPDQQLVFYDDTYRHIEAAYNLNLPNLQVIFIDNKPEKLEKAAFSFYEDQLEWLVQKHFETNQHQLC